MSTIKNGVSTQSDVSVVPGSHAETAQERLNELRRMRGQIPHFVIPVSTDQAIRLHSAASVPPEFVELTAVAVANEKALVRGDAVTPAEVRDLMSYAEFYSPVADEAEALAQFIRHSVTAARNRAGSEALTTYSLAQRLAKRAEHAGLAPYVADMRRALGRFRKLTAEEAAQRAAAKTAKAAAEAAAKAARAAAKAAAAATPPPALSPDPTTKQSS